MTARNTDYDAAQALLDLQGPVKQEHSGPCKYRADDRFINNRNNYVVAL